MVSWSVCIARFARGLESTGKLWFHRPVVGRGENVG